MNFVDELLVEGVGKVKGKELGKVEIEGAANLIFSNIVTSSHAPHTV